MNKAIFLDRDGVINHEISYTTRLEDFIILPDVIDLLSYLKSKGYLLIVITNQGGLSKKLFTKEELEKMHAYLSDELSKSNVQLTEIYYCPHHPDSNSGKCICRKPDSSMIEKAIARFKIDPAKSYFIGDKQTDMQAGDKAGVKGVLVSKNVSLKFLKGIIN